MSFSLIQIGSADGVVRFLVMVRDGERLEFYEVDVWPYQDCIYIDSV